MGVYHKVLGISEGATETEIKKAYRKLASEFHPDKHIGKSEEEIQSKKERFQEVQSAYDGLMEGNVGPTVGFSPGIDINKEMDELMRAAAQAYSAGRDAYNHTYNAATGQSIITQVVEAPIEKMLRGGVVDFSIINPIQSGGGYGLNFRFIRTKRSIKLKPDTPVGYEHIAGESGKEVKFIIMPANSSTCIAQGIDLLMDRDIDLFDALIGGTINIDHPGGTSLRVRVPAGITNGSIVRIHGKGLRDTRGMRGDLYLQTSIEIPKLNDKERKIFQEAIKKIRKN